jgi:hypothetical protein
VRSVCRISSRIIVTRETERGHVSAIFPCVEVCAVPELTRSAGIQLNAQVSSRCHREQDEGDDRRRTATRADKTSSGLLAERRSYMSITDNSAAFHHLKIGN